MRRKKEKSSLFEQLESFGMLAFAMVQVEKLMVALREGRNWGIKKRVGSL
jgi:hypothetical protein